METITVVRDDLNIEDVLSMPLAFNVEQNIYGVATQVSEGDYNGGRWAMNTLSNGGWFYNWEESRMIKCSNPSAYWSGELSAVAFSVCVNIYVCSHMSFMLVEKGREDDAEILAENYYKLRDFFLQDNSPFSEETVGDMLRLVD